MVTTYQNPLNGYEMTDGSPAQETGQQDAERAKALKALDFVKDYSNLNEFGQNRMGVKERYDESIKRIHNYLSAEKNYVGEKCPVCHDPDMVLMHRETAQSFMSAPSSPREGVAAGHRTEPHSGEEMTPKDQQEKAEALAHIRFVRERLSNAKFREILGMAEAALSQTPQHNVEPDLSKCPRCGGEADNGHDRCYPPNPYFCTKCERDRTGGLSVLNELETPQQCQGGEEIERLKNFIIREVKGCDLPSHLDEMEEITDQRHRGVRSAEQRKVDVETVREELHDHISAKTGVTYSECCEAHVDMAIDHLHAQGHLRDKG